MIEQTPGVGARRDSPPLISSLAMRDDGARTLNNDLSGVVQLVAPHRKAWSTYPSRAYRMPDGDVCVPFREWANQNASRQVKAMGLKADDDVPVMIRDQLGEWREAFTGRETSVLAFEGGRYVTLLDVRAGTWATKRHAREFPVTAHIAQLDAIRRLSVFVAGVGELDSEQEGGVDAPYFARMRNHLADLRDSALDMTTVSLRSQLALLNRELTEVRTLNELTAAAQPERTSGGESVPLRLARRGDNFVLKPAATHSVFSDKQKRARTETASLALLLGLPASTPVTLDVLRSRGFCGGNGDGPQWLQAREAALVGWREESEAVLEGIEKMRAGGGVDSSPNLVPDDAMVEDNVIEAPAPVALREDIVTVHRADDEPEAEAEAGPHRQSGAARHREGSTPVAGGARTRKPAAQRSAASRAARRQTIAMSGLPKMGAPEADPASRQPQSSRLSRVSRPKSPPPPPPPRSLPPSDDESPAVAPTARQPLRRDKSSVRYLCDLLSGDWKAGGAHARAHAQALKRFPEGDRTERETRDRVQGVAHTAAEANALASDRAPYGPFATMIDKHYRASDEVVYEMLSRLLALHAWLDKYFLRCDANDQLFQCGRDRMWLDLYFDAEAAMTKDVSMAEVDEIMLRAVEAIDPARTMWDAFTECESKLPDDEFSKLWPSTRL